MARYRKIDPRIWNDEKFSSLSHEAQRIFLFVLTHPSMTGLGAFRISRSGMAEELGLDSEGFGIHFGELLRKGLLKYDERAFLLFAPNFIKYNAPENPNVVKGWAGAIDLLPECPLMLDVLLTAKVCTSNNDGLSKAFANTLERVTKTLSERYGKQYGEPSLKGMPNQEQKQEQDIYSDTNVSLVETDVCDINEPDELVSEKVEKKQDRESCPYQSIVTEYNAILGSYIGECRSLTATRKQRMRSRWLEAKKGGCFQTEAEGIDYFHQYFEHVSKSDFLMGRSKPRFGETVAWRANFDFLFKPDNFIKIIEGTYHRRRE